ncbi:Sulfate transporter 4.1, chloroplastic [Phytophthora ramorum]|uniref:STAS domain-containing protein n=1 Tax=Phytophthora ramorum TaxID=164328 RepID=H3GR59_PHYRM|nr:Sulfate transporter 4.1, chloroplastic [Phytophthora ramorum]
MASWLCSLAGRRESERFALPKKTWTQHVQHYAPIFRWLPNYNVAKDLKFDIVAGITVAMMLIPQEVSLSTIMNVPAHHGLYTAATAPLVYAIFGSSTVLSVSSGSEVSLLVGTILDDVDDQDERVATGIMMAFLSGCILLIVRILNLSQLADFFSRPVMGGFVSAGGLLIMLSQFSNALGIKFASQDYPPQTVYQIFNHIGSTNLTALAVAAISIAYLFGVKVFKKRFFPSPVLMQLFETDKPEVQAEETQQIHTPAGNNTAEVTHSHGFSITDQQYVSMESARQRRGDHTPQPEAVEKTLSESPKQSKGKLLAIFFVRTLCDLGPLVVCIVGGVVGYVLGSSHLKLTGKIPGGFPDPKVPWYGFDSGLIASDRFGTILYNSLTVVVVVFLSSIAMAKRLAIQRGEDINCDQELTGLGIASVVCGFFQAMPPTGGMSRTAVNLLNAHTQLSSIITTLIVILALYTLTGAMYYLPSATLASIIIVAGYSLVEFKEAKWLYRVKRDEFVVWTASFVLTLGLGVLDGLIASIVCSVLALMWKTKTSPVVILGELDNGRFVDRELFSEAHDLGDVIAIRVDSSLYFANCERVALFAEREMVRLRTQGIATRGVVLDMCNMNDLDATTIQVLSDMQEKLAVRNVRFAIANAKSRLHDIVASTNIIKRILANDPSISVEEAVRMLRDMPPSGHTSPSSMSRLSTVQDKV